MTTIVFAFVLAFIWAAIVLPVWYYGVHKPNQKNSTMEKNMEESTTFTYLDSHKQKHYASKTSQTRAQTYEE